MFAQQWYESNCSISMYVLINFWQFVRNLHQAKNARLSGNKILRDPAGQNSAQILTYQCPVYVWPYLLYSVQIESTGNILHLLNSCVKFFYSPSMNKTKHSGHEFVHIYRIWFLLNSVTLTYEVRTWIAATVLQCLVRWTFCVEVAGCLWKGNLWFTLVIC